MQIYFAEHFRRLRMMVFPYGEDMYIRSLSRCVHWQARGGKSDSYFCKTLGEIYIIFEVYDQVTLIVLNAEIGLILILIFICLSFD